MKIALLVAALAALVTAAPSLSKKGGLLSLEEALKLENLSKKFGEVETSMQDKYKVHYCAAKEMDKCDMKCAYYYDMDPDDGLLSGGCMNDADSKVYQQASDAVEAYKQELEEKYGDEIPY